MCQVPQPTRLRDDRERLDVSIPQTVWSICLSQPCSMAVNYASNVPVLSAQAPASRFLACAPARAVKAGPICCACGDACLLGQLLHPTGIRRDHVEWLHGIMPSCRFRPRTTTLIRARFAVFFAQHVDRVIVQEHFWFHALNGMPFERAG